MMDTALRAEIELSVDHVVMRLCGSLCLDNEDRLRRYFEGVLTARVAPGLTIDLTGIEFIDSTGIRALISLRSRAIDAGMDPTFVSGKAADRLFRLLDLEDVFRPKLAATAFSRRTLAVPAIESASLAG